MDQPIFSVSEFNELVNNHLNLLGEVVIEGELSQLKISQNKWIFGSIKDQTASVDIFGVKYQLTNINSLDEGMLVKIYGSPRLYQKTGRFSIFVNQIIPSGEGALKAAYEKLKQDLDKEGLFDPARKRKLPTFPERIGLITAKNSQAYNDFVKVSTQRSGGFTTYFFPVSVQGKDAVITIKQAIHYFNQEQEVDVIILTRGGGSLEDLIAFNDESVTRAVFASHTPIVCAIGHEGDVSLAELASDLRASTPSNAAELVVRHKLEVNQEIRSNLDLIENAILTQISRYQSRVIQDTIQISHTVETLLLQYQNFTRQSLQIIQKHIMSRFHQVNQTINNFHHQLTSFSKQLTLHQRAVVSLTHRLALSYSLFVKHTLINILHLGQKLHLLDPRQLLKKGYSITRNQAGKIIHSLDQLKLQEKISLQLADGIIDSQVINKRKE